MSIRKNKNVPKGYKKRRIRILAHFKTLIKGWLLTPIFLSMSILLNKWNIKRMRAKQADNFRRAQAHKEFPLNILNAFTILLKYHVIVKEDTMLMKLRKVQVRCIDFCNA